MANTRDKHEIITLAASAARTSTGTASAVRLPISFRACAFTLDVTAAATDAADTLDVKIQTLLDGTNWTDVCAFTQVLGNGGAKRYVGKIAAAVANAEFEVGTALAAGNIRHLFGDEYRAVWTIVDADVDASFTFAVTACPM